MLHPLANSLIGTTVAPGVQIQARPGEGVQGFAELASGLSRRDDGTTASLDTLVSAMPLTDAEVESPPEMAEVDAVNDEQALLSPLSPSPQSLPGPAGPEQPLADDGTQAPMIGDMAAPLAMTPPTAALNSGSGDGRAAVAGVAVEPAPSTIGLPEQAVPVLSRPFAPSQVVQGMADEAMAVTAAPQAATQLAVGTQTKVGERTSPLTAPVPALHSAQATASLRAWNPMTLNAVVDAGPVTAHTPVADSLEGARPVAELGVQAQAQARGSQWGPLPLDAGGGSEQLGRQMLAPLKEQIRFSLEHRITKAEVRLDPPELGRIDLSVRQEGDRITVQLHAANPAVREALASGAERLRSDMAQALTGEVQVDVGQGAPGERQQPQYPETEGQVIASHHSTVTTADSERDLIDMLA